MKNHTPTPSDIFNAEDSNNTANPQFDQILATRLSRRNILRGSMGMAGMGLIGAGGLTACATGAPMGPVAHAIARLGFKPVAKSLADQVIVPDGYTAQVIYALGDPLTANVPAFKNDGTDTAFDQRAGDHHDGMEWFGLDAAGNSSILS